MKDRPMPLIADELVRTVDDTAVHLGMLDDRAAAAKPRPDVWSCKEILGHLIDSAINNQHRFIRAQQADRLVFPGYAQDPWVASQGYQERPWLDLIQLWQLLNHHLAQTIRRIPDSALATPCEIGGETDAGHTVTLRFLVEDYFVHMRHHLAQIEERQPAV